MTASVLDMNVVKTISHFQQAVSFATHWYTRSMPKVRTHTYTQTSVAPPLLQWELDHSITVTRAGVSMLPRNTGKGNKIGARVPAGRWWITRQNAPLSKWVSHFAITGRSYSTLASPIYTSHPSKSHPLHTQKVCGRQCAEEYWKEPATRIRTCTSHVTTWEKADDARCTIIYHRPPFITIYVLLLVRAFQKIWGREVCVDGHYTCMWVSN